MTLRHEQEIFSHKNENFRIVFCSDGRILYCDPEIHIVRCVTNKSF